MRRFVGILALALAGCAGAAAPGVERGEVATGPAVSCREGGPGTEPVRSRDVQIGPLTILRARRSASDRRDAFNGHGWKLPVLVRAGETATLSVPRALRRRVGLVFTQATQARVVRRGVAAADSRMRFAACAGADAPAWTGWPGGIVVDRRRCAKLRVRPVGAAEPIVRRVPLGKRCR